MINDLTPSSTELLPPPNLSLPALSPSLDCNLRPSRSVNYMCCVLWERIGGRRKQSSDPEPVQHSSAPHLPSLRFLINLCSAINFVYGRLDFFDFDFEVECSFSTRLIETCRPRPHHTRKSALFPLIFLFYLFFFLALLSSTQFLLPH